MSNNKFTPGPWKWTKGYACGPSDEPGRTALQAGDENMIIYSCDGCSLFGDESLADSRLIAASPDLYVALKLFMNIWTSGDAERIPELWDKATAAIEKAEGEQAQ